MTTKHIVDGLMQVTRSHSVRRCTIMLGLTEGTLCRLAKGQSHDMNLSLIDRITQRSGVSADTLLAWYRMPEGVALGRINITNIHAELAKEPA